jgi:hypothetical protein
VETIRRSFLSSFEAIQYLKGVFAGVLYTPDRARAAVAEVGGVFRGCTMYDFTYEVEWVSSTRAHQMDAKASLNHVIETETNQICGATNGIAL